jgi:glycine/D-amino acid oxidase-like deaminating enzyme
MVGATDVHGSLFTEHCALVHPGRMVRGLAEAVERFGARIYESTPALALVQGEVTTPQGTVRAPVIVRATEGFTPQFKEHRRTLVPLYSLVLATEPLPLGLRESLGLTHRAAVNDMRHLRIYAQVTPDGRLVSAAAGRPTTSARRSPPTSTPRRGSTGRSGTRCWSSSPRWKACRSPTNGVAPSGPP